MPTYFSFYIVVFTAIFSLFFIKKFKNTTYIYFIFYLVFTALIEIIAFVFKTQLGLSNYPVYNILIISSFLFFFRFYYLIFKKEANRIIMNLFTGILIIFTISNFLFFDANFITNFLSDILVFGSLLLIITLILFLLEIINNDKMIVNVTKSFIFWVSVGTLLFYIGTTPIMISKSYFNSKPLYASIITILNVIMYGSFVIGFLKSDVKYNY